MRVKTAIVTGLTGIMLATGLGASASGQVIYERPRVERGYRSAGYWRAEQTVRQAYRDVLRREADPEGLREYTDAMVRRGWSAADVRRSLQQSTEYRRNFGRGSWWRYR